MRARVARDALMLASALAALALLLAISGCSSRSGNPARIATGYISHVVCSYVFASGLDPARVNEEDIAGNLVFKGFGWALGHEVDRDKRQVTARALGGFESRAIYRVDAGIRNGLPKPESRSGRRLTGLPASGCGPSI